MNVAGNEITAAIVMMRSSWTRLATNGYAASHSVPARTRPDAIAMTATFAITHAANARGSLGWRRNRTRPRPSVGAVVNGWGDVPIELMRRSWWAAAHRTRCESPATARKVGNQSWCWTTSFETVP